MKKTKKEINPKELVTLKILSGGKETILKNESVIELLRNLPLDPLKLKTKMIMEFMGKVKYTRMLNLSQQRRMLANDTTRLIMAKFVERAIKING